MGIDPLQYKARFCNIYDSNEERVIDIATSKGANGGNFSWWCKFLGDAN